MTIKKFLAHTPVIDATAFVDDMAYVSGEVTIGAASSMWPMSVARGDMNTIMIGARTNVQDGAVLHGTHPSDFYPGNALTIGDDVTIGHNAILHACTIGNRCLVGMGSTVLDGAVIEDDVMLGANSLVPPGKVLEGGHLWFGNPVKKARPLTDKEKDFLQYSAKKYATLAAETMKSEEP